MLLITLKNITSKDQYGDAIDKYFRLGKNLNQRDTIAVRRMVDGYLKLLYPDGEFTKEQVEGGGCGHNPGHLKR